MHQKRSKSRKFHLRPRISLKTTASNFRVFRMSFGNLRSCFFCQYQSIYIVHDHKKNNLISVLFHSIQMVWVVIWGIVYRLEQPYCSLHAKFLNMLNAFKILRNSHSSVEHCKCRCEVDVMFWSLFANWFRISTDKMNNGHFTKCFMP